MNIAPESATLRGRTVRDHLSITRRELVLIGAAIAVGLALRLYFYSGLIASDDLTHAHAAQHMFEERGPFDPTASNSYTSSANGRRIAVNLPLFASIRVFGAHEWSLALVPLLFSLLGIWIAALTLRRFAWHILEARSAQSESFSATGPPTLAWRPWLEIASIGTAWLWATLPIDIYTATVWMQDNIFATTLMATIYCLLRLPDRPRLFAILTGLLLGYLQFCKENAAFLTFVVGAWLIVQIVHNANERRTWVLRMAWMAAAYVAVHLATIAYFWKVTGEPFFYYTTTIDRYLVIAKNLPIRFPFPENWSRFYHYLRENWIFGFGVVLSPLWVAAMFTLRGLRYRLLLVSVFAIQLFILVQALKLGSWTQRYTLQVSAVYVVLAAAGILSVTRWLPRAWRLGNSRSRRELVTLATAFAVLVALQLLSLDKANQQHGRFRGQTVRDGFAYLEQAASANDRIYLDWVNGMPTFTKRSFDVLNGFRTFKGGMIPMTEVNGATDGWVVLSHLEDNYRDWAKLDERPIPDNWLEVFRSENNHRKYWIRIFRILPTATDIRIIRTPERGNVVDLTGLRFVPRTDTALAVSAKWQSGLSTIAADAATPSRFTVAADATAGHHYGGLEFPVEGLTAIRFGLEVDNAADLEAVFVYAHDANGKRSTRWRWTLRAEQRRGPLDEPVALVVGEPSAGFNVVNADVPAQEIASVTILLRIRAGATITAQIHDLATVETLRADGSDSAAPVVEDGGVALDAGTSATHDSDAAIAPANATGDGGR